MGVSPCKNKKQTARLFFLVIFHYILNILYAFRVGDFQLPNVQDNLNWRYFPVKTLHHHRHFAIGTGKKIFVCAKNSNSNEDGTNYDRIFENIIKVLGTKVGPPDLSLRLIFLIPVVVSLANNNFVYTPIFLFFLSLSRSVEAPDGTAVLAALLSSAVLSPALAGPSPGLQEWAVPLTLAGLVTVAGAAALGSTATSESAAWQEEREESYLDEIEDADFSPNDDRLERNGDLEKWDTLFNEKQKKSME